jgi:hypothetical protein
MFALPPLAASIFGAFGKQIAIGALVLVLGLGTWLHGYGKGKDRVQRKWDAAIAAEQKAGTAARDRAESIIRSGRVRGRDPFNRVNQ